MGDQHHGRALLAGLSHQRTHHQCSRHGIQVTSGLIGQYQRRAVYTPTDADFYCVEPVTHLNNAVLQPDPVKHGIVVLDAGEAMRLVALLRRSTESKG